MSRWWLGSEHPRRHRPSCSLISVLLHKNHPPGTVLSSRVFPNCLCLWRRRLGISRGAHDRVTKVQRWICQLSLKCRLVNNITFTKFYLLTGVTGHPRLTQGGHWKGMQTLRRGGHRGTSVQTVTTFLPLSSIRQPSYMKSAPLPCRCP